MHTSLRLQTTFAFTALVGFVGLGVALAWRADRAAASLSWQKFETPHGTGAPSGHPLVSPVRRVVALSLAAEEIILDLAGPSSLAAISPWARNPRYSNLVEKASAVTETVDGQSMERLLTLDPDCVLVASYTDPRAKEILWRSRIPLVELPRFRSFENIRQAIGLVGELLQEGPQTRRLLEEFDGRLEATRQRVRAALGERGDRRIRVLYIGTDLNSPWTAGRDTLVDQILRAAGAGNVAAEQGVSGEISLNKEAILLWKPEVLLLEGEASARDVRLLRLEQDPALSVLEAVRHGKIVLLPTRLITSASHYAAVAAERLVEALYPRGGRAR